MSEQATDLLHAILLGAMLLLLVGGLLGIAMLWYVRGRDPRAGLVADILPEPPDDLPPGAVGTLIDERADHHDVVATLVGLGRHDAITFHEIRDERGRLVDHEISVVDAGNVQNQLEQDLLRTLFGGTPEPASVVRLSEVKGRFTAAKETIRQDLYRELVTRGYFLRNPEQTRDRWRKLGIAGVVISLVIGVALAIVVDGWFLLPTIALMIVWGVLAFASRWMSRKTAKGAEAAAKWRAFRRYLVDLQQRKDVPEASHIFERYLPYAIAFKIDKEWVRSFTRMGVERPGWYGPDLGDVIIFGDIGVPGGFPSMGGVGLPGDGIDLPSMPDVSLGGGLQTLSDVTGSGFQGLSDGLSGLLDSAGSIFDAIDFDS